jgi:hypothetical protein
VGDANRDEPAELEVTATDPDASPGRTPTNSTVAVPHTRAVEQRLLVQEIARLGLAAAGVLLLFVIVIAALLRATTWEETRTVLDLFVPVITALIGAMAGFYFAERRER